MRYLHDFQPRNPDRLSICQPSSSAVESPPKQRPLDNSGPIWSTTSASEIAIAAQPMDPTFALTDSFNKNLNVTAMPFSADRFTASAPIAQTSIRTRVPPPVGTICMREFNDLLIIEAPPIPTIQRKRVSNYYDDPDDGSDLENNDYDDYEL